MTVCHLAPASGLRDRSPAKARAIVGTRGCRNITHGYIVHCRGHIFGRAAGLSRSRLARESVAICNVKCFAVQKPNNRAGGRDALGRLGRAGL